MAVDKNALFDLVNALTVDGNFNHEDLLYTVNWLITNGDMEGSPRDMIQIRRGNKADIPTLAQGEMAFTLDTNEFYVGGTQGNVRINSDTMYANVIQFGAKGDGSDATQAFKEAIESLTEGGTLFIPHGVYLISETLQLTKTLYIMGEGYPSVIRGSVNPIFNTDTDLNHKLTMERMKIETLSSNTALNIVKTWDAGAIHSYTVNDIWFDAVGNAGSLVKIYGARESGFNDCVFTGRLSWATSYGTAIGIDLHGDAVGGAMNLDFSGCKFYNLNQAVKGIGDPLHSYYFAGFRFTNCIIIGCNRGIDMQSGGQLIFSSSMIDYCISPITLSYWGGGQVSDNYIACTFETSNAIVIKPIYGTSEEIFIHDNGIYTYGDYNSSAMTARGIYLDGTGGNGNVQHIDIHNNVFRNLAVGIEVAGFSYSLTAYGNQIGDNQFFKSKAAVKLSAYSVNNRVHDNYVDVVTIPFQDEGQRNRFDGNQVGEQYGSMATKYSVGSTAATYSYSFLHNLYKIPDYVSAVPANTVTRDAGLYSVSCDDTHIFINFATPTTAGIALSWFIQASV